MLEDDDDDDDGSHCGVGLQVIYMNRWLELDVMMMEMMIMMMMEVTMMIVWRVDLG